MPDPREPGAIDLVWLLQMTHQQYLDHFRTTAIRRAKRWMLQRNAAVALGNVGTEESLPALIHAMRTDEHPIVRGHAAWAVGHMGHRLRLARPQEALEQALVEEHDESVREEIQTALHEIGR